jgi:hypothetical protein
MTQTTQLHCACGQVDLEVVGAPIISAECCCNSCRAAAARLQTLPGIPPMLGPHGETRFVLYRKDRVRFLKGVEHLKDLRLTPKAKTRRAVATCCNTPVFLDFQGGHWLSLYGSLWPAGALPPLALRTMTSDLPDASVLPEDVPNYKRQSVSFFAKLFGAWVAMGFRSPKIAANGVLHV